MACAKCQQREQQRGSDWCLNCILDRKNSHEQFLLEVVLGLRLPTWQWGSVETDHTTILENTEHTFFNAFTVQRNNGDPRIQLVEPTITIVRDDTQELVAPNTALTHGCTYRLFVPEGSIALVRINRQIPHLLEDETYVLSQLHRLGIYSDQMLVMLVDAMLIILTNTADNRHNKTGFYTDAILFAPSPADSFNVLQLMITHIIEDNPIESIGNKLARQLLDAACRHPGNTYVLPALSICDKTMYFIYTSEWARAQETMPARTELIPFVHQQWHGAKNGIPVYFDGHTCTNVSYLEATLLSTERQPTPTHELKAFIDELMTRAEFTESEKILALAVAPTLPEISRFVLRDTVPAFNHWRLQRKLDRGARGFAIPWGQCDSTILIGDIHTFDTLGFRLYIDEYDCHVFALISGSVQIFCENTQKTLVGPETKELTFGHTYEFTEHGRRLAKVAIYDDESLGPMVIPVFKKNPEPSVFPPPLVYNNELEDWCGDMALEDRGVKTNSLRIVCGSLATSFPISNETAITFAGKLDELILAGTAAEVAVRGHDKKVWWSNTYSYYTADSEWGPSKSKEAHTIHSNVGVEFNKTLYHTLYSAKWDPKIPHGDDVVLMGAAFNIEAVGHIADFLHTMNEGRQTKPRAKLLETADAERPPAIFVIVAFSPEVAATAHQDPHRPINEDPPPMSGVLGSKENAIVLTSEDEHEPMWWDPPRRLNSA
jgi:hypothetical protein